ncbi:DUF1232 domain-containing protein [Nostocoides sp. F2B08]|uniref:YkvA family protein n=1 Tax=Nostocoides sp. F2B08 TaxID=2653936 RepID=UPI001263699B|nr:DUF1232 domain-containing protein [Tetrasphaera sp. F2B08]KAB7741037.1 DUF1232 domain-containing protein [Tetrasphaera sp. F2B08]
MARARSRVVLLTTFYRAARIAMRPGGPGLAARLRAVPRMVSATLSGRYEGLGKGPLALMLAAVAYVVSPVDLVPEGALLMLGLADDAMVLGWLAAALVGGTEDFLAWERSEPTAPEDVGPATVVSSTR